MQINKSISNFKFQISNLVVKNLSVEVEGKRIVNDVSLEVKTGEVHVVMGPNGSGKSSLALAIAGHPRYQTKMSNVKCHPSTPSTLLGTSSLRAGMSKILIDKKDITGMKADGRAREGIFLAFQNPVATPGVGVSSILRMVKKDSGFGEFYEELKRICKELHLGEEFLRRPLNEDMSGGEKKKMEILQALILEPKFIIFDEIDTGLDVDALKMIGEKINKMREKAGIIIITHYQRILKYVKADFVHIFMGGRIVKSGGREVAEEVEREGYRNFQ